MSWKLAWAARWAMIWRRASAREALLASSRLVVGSSSARMPQFRQKVSASASRMIKHASTCAVHTVKVLHHSAARAKAG